MKNYIIYTFAFVFSFNVIAQSNHTLKSDLEALRAIYNKLGGENWTNNTGWANADNCEPCNNWYGVECKKGRVISIKLQENNLVGELPNELYKLDKLQVLLLGNNKISGELPNEICFLEKLKVLQLSRNEISGKLPGSLGSLKNLERLFLTHNNLKGTLPSSFGKLAKLKMLYLGGNELIGTIPESLSNLQNLEAFVIAENNFEVSLPEVVKQLNIEKLEANYNQTNSALAE